MASADFRLKGFNKRSNKTQLKAFPFFSCIAFQKKAIKIEAVKRRPNCNLTCKLQPFITKHALVPKGRTSDINAAI